MICASISFVWFHTNAFVEYMRLLQLDSLCFIHEFNQVSADDSVLTYPDFLVANYNSFFTRLISCPKCSLFWIAGIVNFVFMAGLLVGGLPSLLWPVLVVVCIIPSWLILTYCSLFLHYKLVKLLSTWAIISTVLSCLAEAIPIVPVISNHLPAKNQVLAATYPTPPVLQYHYLH